MDKWTEWHFSRIKICNYLWNRKRFADLWPPQLTCSEPALDFGYCKNTAPAQNNNHFPVKQVGKSHCWEQNHALCWIKIFINRGRSLPWPMPWTKPDTSSIWLLQLTINHYLEYLGKDNTKLSPEKLKGENTSLEIQFCPHSRFQTPVDIPLTNQSCSIYRMM